MLAAFFAALLATQAVLSAPLNDVLTPGWVQVTGPQETRNGTANLEYYLNNNGDIVSFTRAAEDSKSTNPGPTQFTIYTPMQSCSKISVPFDLVYQSNRFVGTINQNGAFNGTQGFFRELQYASAASNIYVIDCRTLELTLDVRGGSVSALCNVDSRLEYDNTGDNTVGSCTGNSTPVTLTYRVGASPFAA